MFYTRGFSAMFYTRGLGVSVPVRVPFGAVHGMGTLKPTKVKEGIFRPVAKRYIYFDMLTWLEIWRS
jgi:hypothetical protein